MPKFPEPPPVANLQAVGADWRNVPAGTLLWRIYAQGGAHPSDWNRFRAFGPLGARFDHHEPPRREQARRILYAATSAVTCLAEFFQENRVIDVRRNSPWLVGFALTRDVRLLDLRGTWPTRAGASMAINSGLRARARRWSQAIYQTYPEADGLWYASSMHANEPALALYERAADALPVLPTVHRALADPLLRVPLEGAAVELGYDLLLAQ